MLGTISDQTIYLDSNRVQQWNIKHLNTEKILFHQWWRQFAPTWKHFLFVPNIQFLHQFNISSVNQSNGLLFCCAYTLLNIHETAVVSRLAAAHRLGVSYPFDDDKEAKRLFEFYYRVALGEE